MFLFADQLEYDEPMQEKVQRMAQFLLLFYVVAWLRAPVAEDAPANDLNLYRSLQASPVGLLSLPDLNVPRWRRTDCGVQVSQRRHGGLSYWRVVFSIQVLVYCSCELLANVRLFICAVTND
ncbi:hypothetical protein FJT64_001808 [Amphibalanus amphitrite]|uniref:Uncharacterized protein n=1 Tax=Amphibalanus amphitrite TaxID=1232801 RepID=A0A6A4X7F8_AMPAM|nr:hypothetical protein FJT64_001808 [Amphibalanus amphitrite]